MDPPFGGMVEILAHSLKTISFPAGIFCPLKFMYLFLASVGLIQSYLNRLCFTGAKENVKILPTLFFFPYYLQPRVSQYLPDFSMSDYRVNKHTFIASSNKYYPKKLSQFDDSSSNLFIIYRLTTLIMIPISVAQKDKSMDPQCDSSQISI